MINKNKIVKFISSLIIIAIIAPAFLFSQPKQAQAQLASFESGWFGFLVGGTTTTSATANTTNTAISIKNVAKEVARQVIMSTMKRLLAKMTTATVNWINSGFHGAPLFVENPKSFFKDIGKFEIKTLVDTFGYDSMKFPFGRQYALGIINSYKQQATNNAQYSLSNVITDPALLYNYRTDFNTGGWGGFLINTQNPQNNYVGFDILATQQLARRLEGTAQNNAQKVTATLQQGMGFLSPQTCPSNPQYNNLRNQFQQPSFQSKIIYNFQPTVSNIDNAGNPNPAYEAEKRAYDQAYDARVATERGEWAKTSTCPGGLVSTTPGSVVANQITNAMGSNFRQTELGAAMGNSMSAIFDALLNKFIGSGLNALATTTNPPPPRDDWTYEGQSLGSPTDALNDAWNTGPDEEVDLIGFKKQIEGKTIVTINTAPCTIAGVPVSPIQVTEIGCLSVGGTWLPATATTEEIGDTTGGVQNPNRLYISGDIANTIVELALMDNPSSSNAPGLTQIISQIWPKTRELDMCIPGPNIEWQERLQRETDRNSQKLQEKASDQDGEKAARARAVYDELRFASSSFKNWVIDKMILELPRAVIYMDAVDEISETHQQWEELATKKRAKNQALIRLGTIKAGLDSLGATQPAVGSREESILIDLRKQYNAIRSAISSTGTIEDTRADLSTATNKLNRLGTLLTECTQARTISGWTNPGGQDSGATRAGVGVNEKSYFCNDPVNGGYQHDSFQQNFTRSDNYTVTHPSIPLVNGFNVFEYTNKLVKIFTFGFGGNRKVNIQLNCNTIFNASLADYRKELPSLPGVTPEPNPASNTGDGGEALGTCTYTNSGALMDASECLSNGGSWESDECVLRETDVTELNCEAPGEWISNEPPVVPDPDFIRRR